MSHEFLPMQERLRGKLISFPLRGSGSNAGMETSRVISRDYKKKKSSNTLVGYYYPG